MLIIPLLLIHSFVFYLGEAYLGEIDQCVSVVVCMVITELDIGQQPKNVRHNLILKQEFSSGEFL